VHGVRSHAVRPAVRGQRRQLHDLLLAAIEPKTHLREAQRQAAQLLGSIELDRAAAGSRRLA